MGKNTGPPASVYAHEELAEKKGFRILPYDTDQRTFSITRWISWLFRIRYTGTFLIMFNLLYIRMHIPLNAAIQKLKC